MILSLSVLNRKNCTKRRISPSLSIRFFLIFKLWFFLIKIHITIDGIINILKTADPMTVPNAALIPLELSLRIIKNNKDVISSGSDDPMALIVAPLIPLGKFRPTIFEPWLKISQDFHMINEDIRTIINGSVMPSILINYFILRF